MSWSDGTLSLCVVSITATAARRSSYTFDFLLQEVLEIGKDSNSNVFTLESF